MSAFHDSALIGASGSQGSYRISRSVRLRRSASGYFNRTPASASNRKTWTWSGWVKRGEFSATAGIQVLFDSRSGTSDNTVFGLAFGNGTYGTSADGLFVGQYNYFALVTTQVFRDPSAWYHIVLALDTTQATAANRMKLYVNGLQITTFNSTTYPALNADLAINLNQLHTLGSQSGSSSFNDCYLTDINFIDGQGLTPTSFGEFNALTGVWTAKKYSGSYGTNGFSINFSDNSAATAAAIGKDSSGNGNNWTPNNISVTADATYDSMIDTPTPYADGGNGRGNYAVVNPLQQGSYVTLSNGNLTVTGNTATNSALALASVGGLTSGKWYWEYTQGTVNSETCGIVTTYTAGTSLLNGENIGGFGIGARSSGAVYGGTVGSITSWASGDVIGLAVDCDNGAIYWSKNGTWLNSGVPTSGSSKTGAVGIWTPSSAINVQPAFGAYNGGFVSVTFGQRPFTYTPPTGFKALNTQNLPASTIENGATQFNINLSAATSATRTVTGFAFAPDLVVAKNRSYVDRWGWGDSVRGANKTLASDLTNAEVVTTDTIMSFNSDGFTLGADATAYGWNYNRSGNSQYAYWAWKAGGAAVTNTAGSISSQVSANTSAGFSVVTYTGTGANATVGHGLGVAPAMVIAKNRTSGTTDVWLVQHSSLGPTKYIILNRTDAAGTVSTAWNNTAPTSSVFSIGTLADVNRSTNTYVAYCFAEVAGYSKFGSYTGNGSTDGTFVYLGFRPRYIMVKASSIVADWLVYDTARDTYNVMNAELFPNTSGAEQTVSTNDFDFLSNGFKCRRGGTVSNQSGATYIYMAFAENPFKNALAR